jgi:polycystin 1L2
LLHILSIIILVLNRRVVLLDVPVKVLLNTSISISFVFKDEVSISPSNQPGNNYIYEVAVITGIRRHAGTTAHTAIMIYGEIHDSEPYLLTDNDSHMTLQRGTTCSFLLTTKESLGPLSHIRIWHDNKGKDPALFLTRIVVRDIQSGELWHFLCNRWFAVDEGDGMIDRVLPITSEEEMAQFSQMFLAKTQKDLTDSHLWFSVVWRPPHSSFTRVQRVSCCLSLLLCTMMANAMWYEKDKGKYTAVDLGPFQFSWEQISIGVMSSLVVFPINLVLVQLFRQSKLRKHPDIPQRPQQVNNNKVTPMNSDSIPNNYRQLKNERFSSFQLNAREAENCNKTNIFQNQGAALLSLRSAAVFLVPHISKRLKEFESCNEDCYSNLIEPPQTTRVEGGESSKEKTFRGLPHWCSYIAWVGVIVTSLASTAVTLMYGIQFGKRTSEKWLLSMFISVTQDIFISQPLKVIALAVVFAFIIKKPADLDKYSEKEKDMEKKQRVSKCNSKYLYNIDAPCPPITQPSEDTLQMARKRRHQERQMNVILSDIITYLFFLLIILLISYGQRDKSSFLQKESVEGLLMRTNYSGLSKGYLPDQFEKVTLRTLSLGI